MKYNTHYIIYTKQNYKKLIQEDKNARNKQQYNIISTFKSVLYRSSTYM